jgi:hypothetical protein
MLISQGHRAQTDLRKVATMKRRTRRWKLVLIPTLTVVLVISIAGAALAGGAGKGANRAQRVMGSGTEAGIALLPLPEAEQVQLLFLLEEEKLARDVYESFYRTWGRNMDWTPLPPSTREVCSTTTRWRNSTAT